METAPFSSVSALIAALESLDGMPSDEVVDALAHLLQTAEQLASRSHDPELIAAGLVHDVASALEPGCGDHAQAGATLVAPLLGRRTADLVGGHTDAKRYLVTVDRSYAGHLSPASTHTLLLQGGPMTDEELAAFRGRTDWAAMVELRRADDAAKVPDQAVRPVAGWRELLAAVATGATAR